ncbi:TetR/AcrR family transcriptional regulator [soil metagenome]
MAAIPTARERARAELTFEIKDAARRQLAEVGAAALSVRAIARELGMASSAVYRYFPSRDDLLTALIVDAYQALALTLAGAGSRNRRDEYRVRWITLCQALRRWAKKHPHEYALIYGSPVPGYRAPRDTIAPAASVIQGFLDIVGEASAAGTVRPDMAPLPPRLAAQLAEVAAEFAAETPPQVLAATFQAFGQLIGMISLELYGHFVGSLDPAGPFFEHAIEGLADLIGLPKRPGAP